MLENQNGLTKKQRANLSKLADYLEKLPEDYREFDMSRFCGSPTGPFITAMPLCGSVGCAVGHGPDAGIPPLADEKWDEYSNRVFISAHMGGAWEWCFSGAWSDTDNTPQGAAARIRWFLEKDLPADWFDQMVGRSPLCYKEPNHA